MACVSRWIALLATGLAVATHAASSASAEEASSTDEAEAEPTAQVEQEERIPARWQLGLGVGTDFPLSLGGRLLLESPDRIRVSTTLGVLPDGYVQLFNEILLAAGTYDDGIGDILANALTDSLVWRLEAGWRPWADLGWYASVGYQLVTLGGGIQGEDVLALYVQVPEELKHHVAWAMRRYDIEATLHMIMVELGHEWVVWDHLSVRLALGYAGTVAASAAVNPDFPKFGTAPLVAFIGDVEDLVSGMCADYAHLPMLSLSVGYRFLGPEHIETD